MTDIDQQTPNGDDMNPPARAVVPPPSKHQMAVMIWIAVFPTLLGLNLALGPVVRDWPMAVRTLLLATIAVPIVIYGLMPQIQRLRAQIITTNSKG